MAQPQNKWEGEVLPGELRVRREALPDLNRTLRKLGHEYRSVATSLNVIEDTLLSLDETAWASYIRAIQRLFDETFSISDDGDFVPRVSYGEYGECVNCGAPVGIPCEHDGGCVDADRQGGA